MGDSGVKARGEGLLCPQRLQWLGGEGERGQGGPVGPGNDDVEQGATATATVS